MGEAYGASASITTKDNTLPRPGRATHVDISVGNGWTNGGRLWIPFFLTAARSWVLDREHHNIWRWPHVV